MDPMGNRIEKYRTVFVGLSTGVLMGMVRKSCPFSVYSFPRDDTHNGGPKPDGPDGCLTTLSTNGCCDWFRHMIPYTKCHRNALLRFPKALPG